MKLLKYKNIKYIEVYVYDGTHESAKGIIEKIKEHSVHAFNRIVYQKNLMDDTIKFEYHGYTIEKGHMIELGHIMDGNDIGIHKVEDFERWGYSIEE